MKAITSLVIMLLLAILTIETAYAAETATIGGYINRSDTGNGGTTATGLVGATVTNGTNTTTTNATGWWQLDSMRNQTGEGWILTAKGEGFTQATFNCWLNASAGNNVTCHKVLSVLTPSVSGLEAQSITKTEATITWAITATDNVNNNYVGNKVIYSLDSALTNNVFTSDWSNTTATASIKLSGLTPDRTWYYQVQTYNTANSSLAYDATGNGNFNTLKAGTKLKKDVVQPVSPPATSNPIASILAPTSSTSSSKALFIVAIGLLIIVVGYVVTNKPKSKSKGRKRR